MADRLYYGPKDVRSIGPADVRVAASEWFNSLPVERREGVPRSFLVDITSQIIEHLLNDGWLIIKPAPKEKPNAPQ